MGFRFDPFPFCFHYELTLFVSSRSPSSFLLVPSAARIEITHTQMTIYMHLPWEKACLPFLWSLSLSLFSFRMCLQSTKVLRIQLSLFLLSKGRKAIHTEMKKKPKVKADLVKFALYSLIKDAIVYDSNIRVYSL